MTPSPASDRGNSAENGPGSPSSHGSSTFNGGCIRPDCIFGLIVCGWHAQA